MQLREIGEIALKWLIPFILGGFTALAAGVWRDVRTLRDGVQCLLRAEIIRQSEKYTRRGRAPVYAKEALKRAYSAYHTLGGNDVATRLYQQVLGLEEFDPSSSPDA